MSIFVVSITGITNPIEVYGGLPALKDYLNATVGDGATAFRALTTDDDRSRLLVAATRFIDAQYWQGVATGLAGGTPTTLQFPRSGLTNVDGSVLDPTNVPQVLINACFEMVAILADDASVAANQDSGSNVKALGAGTGRVEFFSPTSATDGSGSATVLPTPVDRLVGRWLAAASSAIAAAFAGFATGVNPCSNFRVCTCGCTPCCCAEQRADRGWPL